MDDLAFNVARVSTLPPVAERTASTMYVVRGAGDLVELYFTAKDSGTVYHILDSQDVTKLIEDRLASEQGFIIVPNIAARNLAVVTQTRNTMYYVVDATGDSTVASGSALYAWFAAGRSWFKIMEHEAVDAKPRYSDLVGGPSATAAEIDLAVAKMHDHGNLALLELLSEQNNQLHFRNKPVDSGATGNSGVNVEVEEW